MATQVATLVKQSMVEVGQIVCPECGNDEIFQITRYREEGATLYVRRGDGYEAIEAEGIYWGTVEQLICCECDTILDDRLLEKLERSVAGGVA